MGYTCAKAPRKTALLWAAVCPTKIQGFSLSKKGAPILGDGKQVLLQALGEGGTGS